MSLRKTVMRFDIWCYYSDMEGRHPRLYYLWDWVIGPMVMAMRDGVHNLARWLKYCRRKH